MLVQAASSPASAADHPLPVVDLDQSVSGAMSPMWQTNNTVDAIATSNGVVYAGGWFTQVRPPGAAAGTQQTPRTYLAAFNATTGALVTGFNVRLNGFVQDMAVSSNGTKLYIVGAFTTVNGVARNRIAAINIPSGTLDTAWSANANGNVVAVDATPTAVYAAGDFTTIKNVAKSRFASLSPTTGAVNTAFTASLDVRALAIEAVPEDGRVLVGGSFNTVNGVTTGGMASVDPISGAVMPWAANINQPINIRCAGRVTDIVAEKGMAYVTGEGDPPGCYEGTYQARVSDGELQWISSCLGATQGITLMNDILYKASHQHDCAFTPGDARGGYVGGTGRDTFIRWHLLAQNVDTGEFMHWSPDTNGSGPQPIGPHVIRNDGRQIFVGGDFTKVDGANQQGLVRYAPGAQAVPLRPAIPTVLPTGAGQVRVSWPAVYDADDGTLTYRLYRGNTTTAANLVHTTTAESWPWTRPVMHFDDSGLTPGSTVSYRLTVSDGVRTSPGSSAGTAVVESTDPGPYADLVSSLGASLYWDFDDATTAVTDRSGNGNGAQLVGGATPVPGAFGGSAVDLDGVSGYAASDDARTLTPSFSQSLWFRTTSIAGGSLMAVTDVRNGDGTISDRAVTLDNNGNIVFSVHQPPRTGSPDPLGPRLNNLRLEGPVYNDGLWHQVTATWDSTTGTGRLFTDGVQRFEYVGTAGGLATGYQRVGYTDLAREQAVFGRNFYNLTWPGSEYFDGAVDEVATFPTALTPAQARDLYAAGVAQANGGGSQPSDSPPSASFTASMSGMTGSFDASASTDPDGTITSYDWSFGDGAVAPGGASTTSHTYATAGPHTVTLTVTDNSGQTATTTRQVTAQDSTATPVDTTVVAKGSAWRWYYRAAAPPASWRTAAFNPAAWASGNAVLGFGSTPLGTNIDTFADPATRPQTAYFTRTFEVPDAATVVRLRLTSVADDGAVIYVNGTEVSRANMPTGTITHTTNASTARNTATANQSPVILDVPVSLLVSGSNVVAAETHVNFRRTRDLTFDLEAVLTSTP